MEIGSRSSGLANPSLSSPKIKENHLGTRKVFIDLDVSSSSENLPSLGVAKIKIAKTLEEAELMSNEADTMLYTNTIVALKNDEVIGICHLSREDAFAFLDRTTSLEKVEIRLPILPAINAEEALVDNGEEGSEEEFTAKPLAEEEALQESMPGMDGDGLAD